MERQQFEQLYRQHRFAVYRRCLRMLKNDAEATDMTQEAFIQFLQHPEAFENRASVGTYLYAVATNLCLRKLRDSRARGEMWQGELLRDLESREQTELGGAMTARQVVAALVDEGDTNTALMALYHYVDELSQGEIAELMGVSRVTVNHRLASFRSKARAMLTDQNEKGASDAPE